MSMSFNEFNKQLQQRNIDKQIAYMLAVIYERLVDTANQQVECAKICEVLADAVAKTVHMQKADQAHLRDLLKRVNARDGGAVHTETISNEPV